MCALPQTTTDSWRGALDAFAEDLRRRAVAPKTSRAYAIDACRLRQSRAAASRCQPLTNQILPFARLTIMGCC